MSDQPQSADTRSVLNAAASIRADLDQVQKTMEKAQAAAQATLIVSLYTLGVAVVIFLALKVPKRGTP